MASVELLHRITQVTVWPALLTSHPGAKCEEVNLLLTGQPSCGTLSQKASHLHRPYRVPGLLGPTRCQQWGLRTSGVGHKAEEWDRVSSLRCSRALAMAVQEADNVYQAPQDCI